MFDKYWHLNKSIENQISWCSILFSKQRSENESLKIFKIYFRIQYFLSELKHKIKLHDDQIYKSMIHFCKSQIFLNIIKFIGPGVLACVTCGGGRSEAGHCFNQLFSSFSFFPAFHPLRGNSPDWKFVSPNIL